MDITNKQPPHLERVVTERNELNDKREKLAAFIDSNPVFETLPEEEKGRLQRQLEIMTDYAAILQERIAAF